METKFNVFEILQIAEKIERNGAKFYLKTAELLDDPEVRDTCYKLATWKARHEKILAQRRKRFSEKTGEFGTFDPLEDIHRYFLIGRKLLYTTRAIVDNTDNRQYIG